MKTQPSTIAAMICELIESHISKCNETRTSNEEAVPHIISEAHHTHADIKMISSCNVQKGTQITLMLTDRSSFRILVERDLNRSTKDKKHSIQRGPHERTSSH